MAEEKDSPKKSAAKTVGASEQKSAASRSRIVKDPKTTVARRAAAVRANMGETQKLRSFLTGAGWD